MGQPVVTFHDGLRFHDDVSWDYCTEDDQRFQSEITDPLLLQGRGSPDSSCRSWP